ncbi:MAG TPA: RHS repeat-associated core domain-containing protein [Terracidiphilus sp.]|nr:RHS repeat-associated core domain-containing protein [Terracidiphilus sp.]
MPDYTHYSHILTSPGTPTVTGTDIEITQKYVCRQAVLTPGATSTGTGNTCAVGEDETTYTPTVNTSVCNHSANTVVDPLGNKTIYQFKNYQTCGYSVGETNRQIYQGSSTLLRTVQTSYTGCSLEAIFPQDQITILPNNLQSKIHMDYSGPVCGPAWVKDTLEYDLGPSAPGPLLRETDTPDDCNWKPASTTVKDGSGNQVAVTTYEFDNYTAGISASGAVQHDPNFGTSFTGRCNVTAIERWRNTDGATLTTRMQYDDAGNAISAADPLGHVTTTSYGDSWGDSSCAPSGGNAAAYPTQITTGSLTTTHSYSSCTGGVATTTDPNSQETSFTYDLMGRNILTDFPVPDGGSISTCFSEISGGSCYSSSYPVSVATTQTISSSVNKTTTKVLDGLARVTEAQLNSDPHCNSSTGLKVDTTYDGAGHTHSVSNPYCTVNDPTYVFTNYSYDGLDRVTSLTHPDSTSTTTTYDSASGSANCKTVADEDNKKRKLCDDGVGRTTSVFEDPTGLNYETDYQYNPLNDLTLVTQKGGASSTQWRTRQFTYDSLSELITAANPETGTVCYGTWSGSNCVNGYDADGNLKAKTDARGITVNYFYDNLNRLIAKTYTNDSTSTPVSCYQFGTSPGSGYLNGRLINEWTQAAGTSCPASPPSSGYLTLRSISNYDEMGRLKNEQQCTPLNCGGTHYSMQYTYDYAGDVATSVDSLAPTPYTLTYTYDGADHLRTIQSSWTDSQHRAALFSAQPWGPFGPTSATLGGNINLTRSYNNNRGWLNYEMDLSSVGIFYTYTLGFEPNGNVNSVSDSVVGGWTYTSDVLNRLHSGSATSGSCNGMNISWAYDAWGNRTSQIATGSSGCTIVQPAYTFNSNNQIADSYYDSAGDRTRDAGNNTLAYDAEGRLASINNKATQYVYDAEGIRIAKENSSGAVTASYALDPTGDQVSEMNGSGQWQHSNIFAMGGVYATYGSEQGVQTTRFHMNDWLGSRRVDLSPTPVATLTCFNYPYGDGLSCTGSDTDITEHHFTGKERDTESGNDYFEARYYSSAMGRFMSPDPVIQNELRLLNPQRWNKYAYVINNPLILTDPTGMDAVMADFGTKAVGLGHAGIISVHSNGSARYGDFSPKGGPAPRAPGETRDIALNTKVEFGSDGRPTQASLDALRTELATIEGVPDDTIGLVDFKTTDAEASNLDNWMAEQKGRIRWWEYNVGEGPLGQDCRDYVRQGLNTADLHFTRAQFLRTPNALFEWLSAQAGAYSPPKKVLKEKVTHRICDQNGKNCH